MIYYHWTMWSAIFQTVLVLLKPKLKWFCEGSPDARASSLHLPTYLSSRWQKLQVVILSKVCILKTWELWLAFAGRTFDLRWEMKEKKKIPAGDTITCQGKESLWSSATLANLISMYSDLWLSRQFLFLHTDLLKPEKCFLSPETPSRSACHQTPTSFHQGLKTISNFEEGLFLQFWRTSSLEQISCMCFHLRLLRSGGKKPHLPWTLSIWRRGSTDSGSTWGER